MVPRRHPLRCCLRNAAAGERYALLAWQPAATGGAYAETGPVFVHAQACAGHHEAGYPGAFRHRRQLLRAHDDAGCQVDNHLVDGVDAKTAIEELFTRQDVA